MKPTKPTYNKTNKTIEASNWWTRNVFMDFNKKYATEGRNLAVVTMVIPNTELWGFLSFVFEEQNYLNYKLKMDQAFTKLIYDERLRCDFRATNGDFHTESRICLSVNWNAK